MNRVAVRSYGVVLYELAAEREPWDEMTPMQASHHAHRPGLRLLLIFV